MAVMPIPPTASRTRRDSSGTGEVCRPRSVIPVPASSHSLLSEPGVGMTSAQLWRTSNTRFR